MYTVYSSEIIVKKFSSLNKCSDGCIDNIYCKLYIKECIHQIYVQSAQPT